MTLTSLLSRGLGVFQVLLLLAPLVFTDQARAESDDDDLPLLSAPAAGWRPVLRLGPQDAAENLFTNMTRVDGPNGACPVDDPIPLLSLPLPQSGDWACGEIVNIGETIAIWRIDFEETFGAGYVFLLRSAGVDQTVLSFPGPDGSDRSAILTSARRLASLPITLQPQARAQIFVRISTPQDLLDSDPVLRPETAFDTIVQKRSTSFGILLGTGTLLCLFYILFAKLLNSRPALRYAVYFVATMLAMTSNEGYFNALLGTNPTLAVGTLDKLFEAAQIGAHLAFIAAFLDEGLPGNRLSRWFRYLSAGAVCALLGALTGSFALDGVQGLIDYHDLGYELDPLIEDTLPPWPMLLAAFITAVWLASVLVAAGYLVLRRAKGGGLFAVGAVSLVLALLGLGFADDLAENLGDDNFLLQYVLLFDGLIFAAAIGRQAFGLRDERDAAIQQELNLTREKMHMAETLLETRGDRDRALQLAERHRSHLALTSHDLRQPLTSLGLAVADAEKTSPTLGSSLRSSLDFLKDVLDSTVADTRPENEHAATDLEPVPVQLLISNAERMFSEEARAKGLELTTVPSDLSVLSEAVPLIRILSNLVSNAVKYTHKGGIEISAQRQGDTVALHVRDTGPGMDADELQRIQQRYVRGSAAADVAGDGLGLTSVRDLAQELRLELVIESTPGTGSCFSIRGLVLAA